MMVTFKSDVKKRKKFFTPECFAHPAKMHLGMLLWIIGKYTKPGETILDPMFGCGSTMLACRYGRNVIGVELEQKFVDMAGANWIKVFQMAQRGYKMGTCQVIQGDARQLEGLLVDKCIFSPPFAGSRVETDPDNKKDRYGHYEHGGLKCDIPTSEGQIGNLPYGQVDKVITSPPYAETGVGDWQTGRAEFQAWVINEIATKGYVEWQGKRYTESEWRAMNHGRIDGRTTKGVHKHPTDGYGKEEGQVGNLPYGNIDKIITSPPYEMTVKDHGRVAQERFGNTQTGQAGYSGGGRVDAVVTSPPYENLVRDRTYPNREHLKEKGLGKAKGLGQLSGDNYLLEKPYGEGQGNIGNLKSTSYLEAMSQVYQQCYKVLKPQGLMILVTKDFIRNKERVLLSIDTLKLCEQVGFVLEDWHQRKLTQQSFWRVIYKKKYPDADTIETEDILVMRKGK